MKMKNKFRQLTDYIKSKGGIAVLNELPFVKVDKKQRDDGFGELEESQAIASIRAQHDDDIVSSSHHKKIIRGGAASTNQKPKIRGGSRASFSLGAHNITQIH